MNTLRASLRRRALIEPLEARIAPAAVFWDGGGDGVNWTSPNNWSNDLVPTGADDVTINPAGTLTITLSSGAQAVASLSMPGDDALSITGGSLALAGASVIHNLALSGSGSLFANAAVSLTGAGSFSGSATLGGTAVVTNNGTLGITSGDPNLRTELVNANGATITHGDAYLDLDGATAKLRVVAGGLYESANTASGFGFRAINAPAGVFVEAGGILRHASPNGASFDVGVSTPLAVQGGTVQNNGANGSWLNLNGAGTFTNAIFQPGAGTAIRFVGVNNTLVGGATGSGAGSVQVDNGTLHADAAGVTLNFPTGLFNWLSSGTLAGPGVFTNTGTIQVSNGDPNLTTELVNPGLIKHGDAYLDLDGAAAKLRVVAGGLYESANTASGFGFRTINAPAGVFIEAGGILRHASPNGASFDVGVATPLTVEGGTLQNNAASGALFNLNGVGTFTNAIFQPGAGTAIRFVGVNNTLVGGATGSGAGSVQVDNGTLHADAAGVTLNFPAGLFNWLSSGTLAGPGIFTNTGTIQISSGDPNLTTELVNPGLIRHGDAYLDLDGAAAKLRVVAGGLYESANTASGFGFRSINAPAGVFIEAGGILRHASPNGATFNLANEMPFTVQGGRLQTQGAAGSALVLSGVGSFVNASFEPAANNSIQFVGPNNTIVGTASGSGAGAIILSSGTLRADANGATLNFPAGLFVVAGSGTLAGPGVFTNTGTIQVSSGEPNLTTELVNPGIIKHGDAYLDFVGAAAKLRVVAGGLYESANTASGFGFRAFNAPAGAFIEAGGILRHASPNGATFNMSNDMPFVVQGGRLQTQGAAGSALVLSGAGSFVNASFEPAANNSIQFVGANNTIVGTASGSGAGAVILSSGTLRADANGATLNFPAGLFVAAGSGTLAGPGVFTNTGTIQISSGDPNLTTELVNKGTIQHGNAFLDLDGAAAKIRTIAGGLYESVNTASGFGFRTINAPAGVFVEAGSIFRHATPNGASFAVGNGTPFSNLGKVEAANGALNFTTPPAQITGAAATATLTGGTWEVATGTTLNLGITGLRTNAADITVRGTGSFTGLGALATNSDSLALLAGADLTTAQAFTNSGALTLSAGSVLTAPSFTQTATGSVAFEIAGAAAAQLGRIAVSGAASLAGTADVSVAPGFSPAAGQNFPLATFASRNGAFASVTGLNVGHANLFEVVNSATNFSLNSLVNASDLAVETVSTPGPVAAGNDVSFSYTVRNTGAFVTPVGAWSDTIYLSRDGVLDSSDIVLTRITHNGAVAAGDTYTANVAVPLVGALPDDYRIIVVADALGRVADTDRSDNTLASAGAFTLSIPTLTAGVAFAGTIASGRDQYFQITLPAGQAPTFTFTGAVAGQAEIYESINAVPTRATFFESAFVANSTVQRIVGDTTAAATYYILVHGRENAGAGQTFSLVAQGAGFDLTGTSVAGGPAIGKVTTTLTGTQFTPGTTFKLVSGGTERTATATYFTDTRTVSATFDLTGLALGSYDIVANNGAATDVLPGAFTVNNGTAGKLFYTYSSPRYIRPPFGEATVLTISYENTGGTDIDAPLFTLLATNARLRLAGDSTFLPATYETGGQQLTTYELLGVSDGLAGVLQPGEKGQIEVIFEPISSVTRAVSTFEVIAAREDSVPFSFDRLKTDLQPAGVGNEAWNAIFANLQSAVGTTVGSYRAMLADNANYLGQLGKVSPDTTELLQFELAQAGDFGAIAARYADGAFGRGSAGLFDSRILVESDGSLTLTDGTSSAFFLRQADGSYKTGRADGSVLTRAASGAVTIFAADGSKTAFRASDGRIDFVEDSNGNRTTATYNAGGQLTTLTNVPTGDTTTYTYNAAGDVATRTDAVGRVTTYTYDAGGQHLASVTSPQGTISYTYVTGQGAAREHALASVTGFDGVTTTYTYDAMGRLAREQVGSGAGAISTDYAYDSAGKVIATDSAGNVTTTFRTVLGQLARVIDADGDVTSATYDASGRLVSTTDPTGLKSKSLFGANGLLEGSISPDRTKTALTYGDLRRVTSVTDAGGDVTQLGYDARGNLLAKILPDGSADRLEYDTAGRVIAATDANGARTTFAYNTVGLLTTKTLASGENVTFTYDAHRNLLTATGSEGVTTFTYDAADRVTSATYPNGKSVAITYDAAGRQATVADQSGYTVRYHYDALGRLDEVRDTGNALLVSYTYDARGQLATETRANGSTTTYTYDAEGREATITHRDAANAVTGFFNYTHDAVGRVKTVATEDGTTTYTYDVNGQLTRVELPGGRSIEYRYDAEGNRTAVVDSQNGTANYTTNSGDQYTSAGAETLTYDGAGRLITSQAGGATTSFGYDAAGRLTSVISAGSVTEYVFDALGNRIAKIENGVQTDFAINPTGLGTVFGEYLGAATVANYAQGLGVAARTSGGATAFYHFDAIGNTSLVSGANGAALATYDYLPFGEISAQTGALAQPLTFNGREGVIDEIGDQYFMRARTYDAGLGRFTSRDPIDLNGGDTNLYRFVRNSPVNFSDPSGLIPGGLYIVNSLNYIPAFLESAGGTIGADFLHFRGAASLMSGFQGLQTEALLANGLSGTPSALINVGPGGGPISTLPSPGTGPALQAPQNVNLTRSPNLGIRGVTAFEAAGLGVIIFGVEAIAIDGGALLFESAFPNAGKTEVQDVLGRSTESLSQRSGASELFTDLYKLGREQGKSDQDATLEAIAFLRKHGIEDPLFNPNPNNPRPTSSEVVRPSDPNNIVGPAGAGADPVPEVIAPGQTRFDGFVNGRGTFPYKIEFENQPSATAPAQVVRVTQTLDADLDLSTFAFTGFGFGAERVLANGGSTFHTIYDATATLGVLVQIDAELNTITGVLNVTYTSLDPATNDVPFDPFAGFLPPDDATGRGDGFLTYTIAPKSGLANATNFTGIASIVFDTEDAIATPTVTNTLDSIVPASQVTPFASATSTRTTFAVRWTGADDVGGSGLAGITLSFTDNGGPLQTATVANADGGFRFTGEVGHTYAFFSQAVDNVGNTETLALTPDATITVIEPTFLTAPGNKITLTDTDGDIYTVKLTGAGTLQYATIDPDGAGPLDGPLDFLVLDGTTNKSNLSVTVKKKGDGIVTIGDVIVDGALGNFAAKASDLNVNGLTATGAVKSIAVRDLLQPDIFAADPLLKTGGTAADKLTITARNLADGFAINTPQTISAITAASIGDGSVSAAALAKLSTSAGGILADLNIAGAVGPITTKGGGAAGTWTGASFGAIKISGGALSADITTVGAIASVSVTGGGLLGDLVSNAPFDKKPAIGNIAITGGDLSGSLTAAGKLGNVTVKENKAGLGGAISGDLTAASIGNVALTGGGLTGSLISTADTTTLGKTAALGNVKITGGDLTGDIDALGKAGSFTIKADKAGAGGGLSGILVAGYFGKFALTGGDFSGNVTAIAAATALGKTLAIGGVSVAGGDLTGNLRALGGIGAVKTSASSAGAGGNVSDATIAASRIASLTVAKNLANSLILAGADLGTDFALGGTGAAADLFAAGTLGAVKIGGNVTAGTIAAGLATTNATLKDGDDGIVGGAASAIATFTIKGSADAASYFAAGKFTGKPKIAGAVVDPATDARFKLG